MTSKTDFFPEDEFPDGVSFEFPDHFVRLHAYRGRLSLDNLIRGRELGEMVPQRLITERLAEEFGLTAEQVLEGAMIGNWISYDRELNAMSEEQRQNYIEEISAPVSDEHRLHLEELGMPSIEEIVEKATEKRLMRELETQVLNDLLNDSKES